MVCANLRVVAAKQLAKVGALNDKHRSISFAPE
jgi:hypothetical protein